MDVYYKNHWKIFQYSKGYLNETKHEEEKHIHILIIKIHSYNVNTQIWTDFLTKQRMRYVLNLLYFHFPCIRLILNFSDTQIIVDWNTISKHQNTKNLFCMCAENSGKNTCEGVKKCHCWPAAWTKNLQLKLNFFTSVFQRLWKHDQLNICINAFLRSTYFCRTT